MKLLKDLPWRIQVRRKEYRLFTNCLQKTKIDYRWLTPGGIIFTYKGTRQKINSSLKAREFLEKNAIDLGYETSDQESKEEGKEEEILNMDDQELDNKDIDTQKTKKFEKTTKTNRNGR